MAQQLMDAFTLAYFEAALWSTNDESTPQGGEPLDKNYSIGDIDDATRDKMIADCADFQERFVELITDDTNDWERAGHDFWLTRNRHGAGFWDGDWPKHGDELTDAAHEYGEFDLYVGDDGMIYGPPPGAYGVREARVDRTSRGRFAGKRVPAPDPGMNPFAPQARIRLDNQWRLGDVGAVYEFNVKLGRVEAEVSDAEWEHDVQIALEEFEDALKNKYPWIGQMYLTGRSGGWLALEDPKGKMTKKTLEALSKLVEASKRQFIKDMEQDYPRGGTAPMTARAPHTVAIGGHGEVIPSRRWKNSRTGAIASPYGAVPWTGAPGDRKEDWELETVGWTIRWADGTVGIGRQPFATKAEAEAWLEQDRARRESYRRAAPAPATPPRTRRRRR